MLAERAEHAAQTLQERIREAGAGVTLRFELRRMKQRGGPTGLAFGRAA
ncbi:hypothetical protein J7I88_18780 [Paraburkholderia strydomiana]|nr:hypothetical protein [Paraburkholderia strydomiana]